MTETKKNLEILAKIRKHKRVGRKKGGGKKQTHVRTHFFLYKELRKAGASWKDLSEFTKIKYGKTIHYNTIRKEYLKQEEKIQEKK